MSKTKLIVAYVFLVGVPLSGLLGILHAGQRLSPPTAVGGAWYMEPDLDALSNGSCRKLLASVKQPFVSISQSGINLVFTLNDLQKTTLPGAIRGAALTMRADRPVADGTAACSNPRAIHLDATVVKQGGQRTLAGTLGIDGCSDCAPIQFRALRQSSHGKEGL